MLEHHKRIKELNINIKSFGAIGDGSSHPLSERFSTLEHAQKKYLCATSLNDEIDWCALQTAINNTDMNNEQIFIPIGTFIINNPINMKSQIKIIGNGKLIFNISDIYGIDFKDLYDISIEGVKIVVNGDSIASHTNGLFNFYNSNNIKIKQTKIISINRNIFFFSGTGSNGRSVNIDICDNDLTTNGTDSASSQYCFIIFSTQRTDVTSITTPGNKSIKIKNNYIHDSSVGIVVDFDNSIVENNSFYLVQAPIACFKIKDSSFHGNDIKGFVGNGLCLGNGTDDLLLNVTVSNNILDGKDDNGNQTSLVNGINIYKQGGDGDPLGTTHPNIKLSKKITVINNSVRNCGANGIFAYGNGNMTITGNVSTDNLGGGISVAGGGGATATHAGKVTVSSNFCRDNGNTGINIGDSSTSVSYVTCIGNTCVENGRGMYIAKTTKSVFANNNLSNNKGYGLLISNSYNCNISNNVIADNITSGDMEGFNGNVSLSLTDANNIKFDNNIVSTLNSYYLNTNIFPTYRKGNQGFPNEEGMFIERNFEISSNSQTVTQNVKLPYTASWYSGQLLVQVSASRVNSSNIYAHHQNCLAIINVVRMLSSIHIGEIKYIHQNQGVDPLNGNVAVSQASVSASVNSDNNSIDITGNSNYTSTNSIVMTISPLRSALFNNYTYI